MNYFGDYPASHAAVCMPFDTFAAATGAPAATTNFAAADIVIFKNGGTTQRTSANGITVTTSFDSNTGLQMVLIDTSDNSDAGFYAAGNEYQVAVADITVDGQTLRFWLGCFSIERAGGALALAKSATSGFAALKTLIDVIDDFLDTEVAAIKAKTDGLPSDPADASVIAGRFDTLDTNVADLPTNAELATALGTADDAVLAQVALVKAKTDNLPTDPADQSLVIAATDAILTAVNTKASQVSVDDLPTNAELATALAAADDAVLAAIAALNNLSQANIRTALGLGSANLDTQLGDLPTNAELATALAAADDAVLAAIAALNNLSPAQVASALATFAAAQPTQSYAAAGAVPTRDQFSFMILQMLSHFTITAVSGTATDGATVSTKKLDGTEAMTHHIDNSATPTSRART